jgi:hypothetical protein
MGTLQRAFTLPETDQRILDEFGKPWETILDGSQWLLIHSFPVPDGYNHKEVTAAILIPQGYPLAALDMVYFNPGLQRIDGVMIKATEATQSIAGQTYQRWSRHMTSANPWRAGKDNIETQICLIQDWLEREFNK